MHSLDVSDPRIAEAHERARLIVLHSGGEERTEEQDVEYAALVERYEDPDFTLHDYGEFLLLDDVGEDRTEAEEERYDEIGARTGLDGANLSEDVIVEIEERRDNGEVLRMRDVIALDAFHRSKRQQRDSIPPSAMLAIISVGRRTAPRRAIPRRASATTRRGSAGRRTTRSSARSPGRQSGSDDPHEHDLAGRRP